MSTRNYLKGAAAVLLVFGFCGSAHAQRATRGARSFSSPARSYASGWYRLSASQAGRRLNSTGLNSSIATNGALNNFGNFGIVGPGSLNQNLQNLLNSVPGLGFDFPHLAAINSTLGVKALIDPVTQGELALALNIQRSVPQGTFFPFFADSAPVVFVPPAEEGQEPQQQSQPQVILVQSPAAGGSQQPSQSQAVAPAPSPLPDVGEFTLVLKNGQQVLAVAFMRQGDRLVYITKDGGRRSIGITDLDSSATQEINEQNGTSVQLPLP